MKEEPPGDGHCQEDVECDRNNEVRGPEADCNSREQARAGFGRLVEGHGTHR